MDLQLHTLIYEMIYSCFSVLHDYVYLQTLLLSVLMKKIGNKNTVLLGLGFQLFQLAWYGFGSEPWWGASEFIESGIGCNVKWAVLWMVWVTGFKITLLSAGWCGRPVPSPLCPVSPFLPWARWCPAARIATSRVRDETQHHTHQNHVLTQYFSCFPVH